MWLPKREATISKVGVLKNGFIVTLNGTNISQVFMLHRAVQRKVQAANAGC